MPPEVRRFASFRLLRGLRFSPPYPCPHLAVQTSDAYLPLVDLSPSFLSLTRMHARAERAACVNTVCSGLVCRLPFNTMGIHAPVV